MLRRSKHTRINSSRVASAFERLSELFSGSFHSLIDLFARLLGRTFGL